MRACPASHANNLTVDGTVKRVDWLDLPEHLPMVAPTSPGKGTLTRSS